MANPQGGGVVAGSAKIGVSGSKLTVTQTSNRSIINWNSFSIAKGETSRFNLPSSTAAVLNRVTGNQLSSLLGNLYSNGQVYLLNPNGIVIGPNGRVNTAGFIASTLDISNQQFMQGGGVTLQGNSTAGVVVLGSVKANDGDVLLVAAQVDNQGKLIAPNGEAILAGGSEVLYVPGEYANIAVAAPAPASGAAVNNTGLIKAASAQLAAAGTPYQLAVNNGGQISATGVGTAGGHVVLQGGGGDIVDNGVIRAHAGNAGGTVDMSAGRIALTGSASVNASAPSGAGRITLAASNAISVAPAANLTASASAKGNGGTIGVKAAKSMRFAGTAKATGGPQGGNGGQAEISGANVFYTGSVDLSAPAGSAGTLLFDPDNITVVSGNAAAPSDISGGLWGFTQDGGTQTISVGAIETLLASANLELQATTSLTVAAPVSGSFASISSNTSNTLTLTSPTIAINAPISLPNGTLVFNSPSTAPYGPALSLTSSSAATLTANAVQVAADYPTLTLSGAVITPSLQFTAPTDVMTVSIANPANAIQAVSFDPSNTSGNAATSVDIETSSALTVSGNLMMSFTGPSNSVLLSAGDLTLAAGTQLQGGPVLSLVSTGGVFNNLAGSSAIVLVGSHQTLIYSATDGTSPSGTEFNDGGVNAIAQSISPTAFGRASGVIYPSNPNTTALLAEYFASVSTGPELTITANSFTRLYGAADPTFTANYTGGSGGGASELTTLPSFRLLQASDVNVGIYTIQPYGAASAVDSLTYVDGLLTVNPAPLIVTANNASMTYGGTAPSLGYSLSGLVNGDTSSIVSGVEISPTPTSSTAAGSYSLTPSNATVAVPAGAIQPNYAVSYQTGTLTVNPAPLSVAAVAQTTTYGSAIPTLPLQFAGFVNQSDASTVPSQFVPVVSAVQGSSAGTYAITLQTLNPNSNYTVTYTGANLTINPASLTITPNLSSTYGGAIPTTLPAADYSGFVNGDTSASLTTLPAFSPQATSASPVGNYAVFASGAIDPNYTIQYGPGTLTISPAPLTIIPNLTKVYGATLPTSLLVADFTGLVNGDTPASLATQPSLSTAATASSSVGSYGIIASGAVDPNYAIQYGPGTLTISPAPLTITPNLTKVYGAALPSSLPVTDFTGLVNGDTPASLTTQPGLSTAATASSSVGSYGVTASGAVDANYTISYTAGSLAVNPAPLTITPNLSKVYGAALPSSLPAADFVGLVNGDTPASLTTQPGFFTSATASSGVGNYGVTASGAVDANYRIGYAAGTLNVTPAPLLITANNASRLYGTQNPTFTASYSGLVNGDSSSVVSGLALETSATPTSNVGSYAISGLGATAANYSISYAPGTLTVNPAPLLITANDVSRLYGASNPSLTASYSGLVDGDTASVVSGLMLTTAATASSNVGSYPIIASSGTATNYTLSYANGTLAITPAPLTIIANATKAYGAPLSSAILPASDFVGFVNGDTVASLTTQPTISSSANVSSPVGSALLTNVSGAADPNYRITTAAGTMTVTPVPLSITANSFNINSDDAPPTLTGTFVGLVASDTQASTGFGFTAPFQFTPGPTGSTLTPGSYPVSLTGNDPNYTVTYTGGAVVVSSVLTNLQNLSTSTNNTINSTDNSQNLTVTLNNNQNAPVTLKTTPGPIFVSLGGPYGTGFTLGNLGTTIIQNMVDALNSTTVNGTVLGGIGSDGKYTVAQIEADLTNPATATQTQTAMLPFIMAELSTILTSNQPLTADQNYFVQEVMSFITAQRQAAAIQAQNDYDAWYQQTVAQEVNQIETVPPGVAQMEMASIVASNPPQPPAWIEQEAKLGMDMTPGQAGTLSTIVSQTNALASLAANPNGVANYLAGAAGDAGSATKIVAEAALDLAGQAVSTAASDAAGKVVTTSFGLTSATIVKGLKNVPGLGNVVKSIFPATYNSARFGFKSATAVAVDVSESLEVFSQIGKVAGTGGFILEAVGNVVQMIVSTAQYTSVAVYNDNFNKDIATDNTPVSFSTLQNMLSSNPNQLYTYLQAMMATGGTTPSPQPSGVPASVYESQTL